MSGNRKVLVAVSGGVDSGVSAALLKEQGFETSGFFMRHRYQRALGTDETRAVLERLSGAKLRVWTLGNQGVDSLRELEWSPDAFPFPMPADSASALELAASLNVELNIVDVDETFSNVVRDFAEKYYAAQTPNPCALCNRTLKFGKLWDVAQAWKADCMATGHYVRKPLVSEWLNAYRAEAPEEFAALPEWVTENPDRSFVARSPSAKDQSYFLYGVNGETLQHVVFPVGEMEKPHVRELAAERGLHVAQRKDSQELCFVPDDGRLDFIHAFKSEHPDVFADVPDDTTGDFIDLEGKPIGRHAGYEKFTIGQRKGLGMGFCERIFVQRIDPVARTVTLGSYDALAVNHIRAVDANWHLNVPFNEDFRCEVRIRYRSAPVTATVRVAPDGMIDAQTDSPCYGVAPGQSLVCYWRDRLLGGGRIVL